MINIQLEQIVNSALWAAYGDALGFITELADERILKTRTGLTRITELIQWKRNIGGKFGTTITLPSGAYSDDTQLRLSTSRSIKMNGHFAIHSFSKIEVPAWQNYALGAGRGSKLAASNLSKANTSWLNNFYDKNGINYVKSGGNGAAMRIQPHVWSASNPEDVESYLIDVIRNSLTTHGHPRAIAGAVFHALSLSYALINKCPPSIKDLQIYNKWTLKIPALIKSDQNLSTVWITQYENLTGYNLSREYKSVYEEIEGYIETIKDWQEKTNPKYSELATMLDLYDETTRGSGSLTSVAASAAAMLYYSAPVGAIFEDIINELHTDTDSIATMVGAIIGSFIETRPPQDLQDDEYIIQDACRLHSISIKKGDVEFNYPDAMTWKNPTSIADYVKVENGKLNFYPFGELVATSKTFHSRAKNNNFCHQWVCSNTGQSFLIKRRDVDLGDNKIPIQESIILPTDNMNKSVAQIEIPTSSPIHIKQPEQELDINKLVLIARESKFDSLIIGDHIKNIAKSQLGMNSVIAYSAIIANEIIKASD